MNKHHYLAMLYGCCTLTVAGLSFGLVLPSLISAASDIAVGVGYVGIPLSLLAIFELGRMTMKQIDAT